LKKWAYPLLGGLFTIQMMTPATAQETDFVAYGVQLEELEYRLGDEREKLAVWNGDAFIGNDEYKLRWLGEGEYDLRVRKFAARDNRLVLQTPVTDFFQIKAGVRLDSPKEKRRWLGVLGLTGLAKQWVEIDADLFVSEIGDVSVRLDAEYELLLTNRLILSPSADIDIAFSNDRRMDVGAGLSKAEVGLRLSYDILDRTISPYVGVIWERKFGGTANIHRDEGKDIEAWYATLGMRILF
jgi:copper resistance protein B